MATLEKPSGAELRPREDMVITGNLAALNAEIILGVEGGSVAVIDLRGAFVLTVTLSGTRDGVNWLDIPVIQEGGGQWLASITAVGLYVARVGGFLQVRARVTAYTSGAAATALGTSLSTIDLINALRLEPATLLVTTYGTANTATTLTIPAAGAGLFHQLTKLIVRAFNESASAIAASAVLNITTGNLPGTLNFRASNDFPAWAMRELVRLDFDAAPLRSSAANTNTTVLVPALGAGVRAEILAVYKVGR
jgi:hypothetical protein